MWVSPGRRGNLHAFGVEAALRRRLDRLWLSTLLPLPQIPKDRHDMALLEEAEDRCLSTKGSQRCSPERPAHLEKRR